MGLSARLSECLSTRTSTIVHFVSSTSLIVRPANRDWACQTERCHTLSNKTSLQ